MIKNLRDLSMIALEDGVPLREHCLIRSANLHTAEPEDLVGIDSVIDMRTQTEVEMMPDRITEWISYYHIPLFDEAAAGITREKKLSEIPDMPKLYRAMLESDSFRAHIQDVLHIISSHDYSRGAVLWHCTAGKDRCGVVSALVLQTLGVHRDAIMRDYLITNDTCREEADMVYWKMLQAGRPEKLARAVRDAFLARAEYLQAALDAYDRKPLAFPEAESFRHSVLLSTDS